MFSKFSMPKQGAAQRGTNTAQEAAPQSAPSTHRIEDVTIRPMRLKILYTFDDKNSTNCLARWPQPLDIRTANLDEITQIGVIELKTCIQAIVAASPELVAQLGQDYTVYAYDYSEYETPLVGQGMLSWVLASSSSSPAAPAHQSTTLVTGRVCRNVMGLFGGNSQETLEVKLRLVPVPTSLQSEYIESMQKYRDVSQMMPSGVDLQAWSAFVQANPNFMKQAMQSRSQSPAASASQMGPFGMEHVQRLLSGDRQQQQSQPSTQQQQQQQQLPLPTLQPNHTRQNLSRVNSFASTDVHQQAPRMPSPALSVQSNVTLPPKRRGRKPGPKGPRGGRATPNPQEAARKNSMPQSADTGYGSADDRFEDGPSQKRAKITQAEWTGRQDFGTQPDSLRVAASTAASVRIHQPTAMRPGPKSAHSLEGPPREPTPVGDPFGRTQKRLTLPKDGPVRESTLPEKKTYAAPYVPPDAQNKPSECFATSPEHSRADSSPADIASSPPVFEGGSTVQSSPLLPALPQHFQDSAFGSGSIDDLFEGDDMPPLDEEDFSMLVQYDPGPSLPVLPDKHCEQAPSPVDGSGDLQQAAPEEARAKQGMRATTVSQAPSLSRTATSSEVLSAPVPASDPVRPTGLNRSQTWSGAPPQQPMSDNTSGVKGSKSRNQRASEAGGASGTKRRQAIQSKLATSVAQGDMPPFCENCGAIETPTWRKAWVKIHSGTPEHVRISEDEGGIIAWQPLQTTSEGIICLYRIIKKTLHEADVGFTEILLCNPCGLFLHNRKCMRPKDVWDRAQKDPDRRRRGADRRPRLNSVTSATGKDREGSTGVFSDGPSPSNDAGGQTDSLQIDPQLPTMKRSRASSHDTASANMKGRSLDETSAAAALQRAIKSSPHKFVGTQHAPIEVADDLTPQPTRRILFPSPTNSKASGSRRNASVDSAGKRTKSPFQSNEDSGAQEDKENHPPRTIEEPCNLPVSDAEALQARPSTPTPVRASGSVSHDEMFKTPIRSPKRPGLPPTTGDFFSSAAKALLRPTLTPKRTPTNSHRGLEHRPLVELTPFTAHLNQLLSESGPIDHHDQDRRLSDHDHSPCSNHTFDFPSLPSLQNTPNRSRILDFDFSAFDSQDLISTDIPMPSSPPAWFGVYEDPDVEDGEDVGGMWAGGDETLPSMFHSSPMKEHEQERFHYQGDPVEKKAAANQKALGGLVVDEDGTARIEFGSIA